MCTGTLPQALLSVKMASATARSVCKPDTTSTSFISGTGLKKCMPTKRPGCARPLAMAVTLIDEVLVASTHCGDTTSSSCLKSARLAASSVKNDFTQFLIQAKNDGKKVAGYGAAAKGNTLLNFAGIKKDLLQFVVDASPHKQNKFLPGVHIPVYDEQKIKTDKPDYIVILPWNIKEEITGQLNYIKEWGGRFVVAVPQLEIF